MSETEISYLIPLKDICQRLDWVEIFGNNQPVELDLGAGDGGFALAYAQKHPEINLLAVERLLGRVRKIEKRAHRQQIKNIRALRLELEYTVQYLLPFASVSIVHIMFPDPWPKRRHWNRRLIKPAFLENLKKILVPEGEFRFTTDHADYFAVALEATAQISGFYPIELWNWPSDPKTDFQQEFDAEGRATYRARWILRE